MLILLGLTALYWFLLPAITIVSLAVFHWKLFAKGIPWIYKYFVWPRRNKIDFKSYGEWAVVTGATDGIGRAYADEGHEITPQASPKPTVMHTIVKLAAKGLSIVLISRTPAKLEKCAKEIESQYKVETRTIAVDFSKGYDIFDIIEAGLRDLEIGVLVNNVGMGITFPMNFVKYPRDFCVRMINTNIHSVVQMTTIVLPQMIERGKGAIMNISSMSATLPTPEMTLYGATKAFVSKFSNDLAIECKDTGVMVYNLTPGTVATNMTYTKKEVFMMPLPTTFVKSAIKLFGCGTESFGYLQHDIVKRIGDFILFIWPPLYHKITKRAMDFGRKRALEQEAKGKFTIEKF